MGRGGPAAPQVVHGGQRLGAAGLLAVSRQGLHAASDYLEDAVLTGLTTVGCRRCGGGMAGASVTDTVRRGPRRSSTTCAAGIVLFEGSGVGDAAGAGASGRLRGLGHAAVRST